MVKVKNIKDIPWYNFTIVRHTSINVPIKENWSSLGFSKRLFVDYNTNLIYTLSAQTEELNKIYNSNIIEDVSYDLEDGSKSYCVEFFIKNGPDICGYVQKFFLGLDTTIFSLLLDPVYSNKSVVYLNRWKRAVNKHGFFWDLTECGIDENDNIQPIDLDEIGNGNDKEDWPWWTQTPKEDWENPRHLQETLSGSGLYLGPEIEPSMMENPFLYSGSHAWIGYLICSSENSWRNHKEKAKAKIVEQRRVEFGSFNPEKNRYDAVNEIYLPYVKKHLDGNPLQNILTCGGSEGAVNVELDRHRDFTYENIFHYEFIDEEIHYDEVIKDNILCPESPIQSVNLIYADIGGGNKCYEKIMKNDIEEGVIKILDNGFINNNLGILVFLYFDGIGIEPFLDKQYGEYKSKDFFSSNIVWDDGYGIGDQRLDGITFFL